jgi:hypothetical protein
LMYASGSAGITATSEGAYAAPATGTAPSVVVTVTTASVVLVTLTTTCYTDAHERSCFMSFDTTGALATSASDARAVGFGRAGPDGADRKFAGSASFVVTVPAGSTTFVGRYRTGGGNGTATFQSSALIVQVFP